MHFFIFAFLVSNFPASWSHIPKQTPHIQILQPLPSSFPTTSNLTQGKTRNICSFFPCTRSSGILACFFDFFTFSASYSMLLFWSSLRFTLFFGCDELRARVLVVLRRDRQPEGLLFSFQEKPRRRPEEERDGGSKTNTPWKRSPEKWWKLEKEVPASCVVQKNNEEKNVK